MKNQLTVTGGRVIDLSPFVVAGIVNATPDSFSDGGLYHQPGAALAHSLRLWGEGAGILDLGGESTRPGSDFVDAETELARLAPVLRGLARVRALRLASPQASLDEICDEYCPESPVGALPDGPLPLVSVDTWRASTARAALELGAEIINDISGALFDPAMVEVLAEYKPGYILGHAPAPPRTMQDAPRYGDAPGAVVDELCDFFTARIAAITAAGLPRECIVLDVGIGFGKSLEHNLELLRHMGRFHSLGCPICLGISRKSFFGDLLGLPKGQARDAATQVVTALLAARGVQIHRVHAVKGAVEALSLYEAII